MRLIMLSVNLSPQPFIILRRGPITLKHPSRLSLSLSLYYIKSYIYRQWFLLHAHYNIFLRHLCIPLVFFVSHAVKEGPSHYGTKQNEQIISLSLHGRSDRMPPAESFGTCERPKTTIFDERVDLITLSYSFILSFEFFPRDYNTSCIHCYHEISYYYNYYIDKPEVKEKNE